MKVLLVRHHDIADVINERSAKSITKARGLVPPLGIAYIAAVLEQNGHDVKILDSPVLGMVPEQVREYFKAERPEVVGITCMTATLHGALEAARFAKEINAITVLGGPHLAVSPEITISNPYVDFGVVGEGEYPMQKLLEALENGGDYSKIPGLVYKKDGKVKVNAPYLVEDLDALPFPARHLLPIERYSTVIAYHPFATIATSRGCPYHCGYCFKTPSDAKYRVRDPKKVVDEIEECIQKYKVKEIMFYDDTLTLRREHVVGICNEILERGVDIKWEAPTRANHIDKDLLKLMKKAGCIRLRFGVESGDDNILQLMRKGITKDMVRKIFKEAEDVGMETFAYFIIGYASETPKTMQATIDFAKEINADWAMFLVATPYPHTELFDLAVENNLVDANYWKDFIQGKRKDRISYLVPDADLWVKKAYREFYLRPGFFIKKLRKLNSFDTFKKYIEGFMGILFFEK